MAINFGKDMPINFGKGLISEVSDWFFSPIDSEGKGKVSRIAGN